MIEIVKSADGYHLRNGGTLRGEPEPEAESEPTEPAKKRTRKAKP